MQRQCTNQCNNREALAGPQKRGRKTGSGAGETRKTPDQYSTNPHTMKSRARKARIDQNPYSAELVRADAASRTWLSRQMKKYYDSTEYKSLPDSEKDNAASKQRSMLEEKR